MHDAADRHPSRRLSQATRERATFLEVMMSPTPKAQLSSETPDTEKKKKQQLISVIKKVSSSYVEVGHRGNVVVIKSKSRRLHDGGFMKEIVLLETSLVRFHTFDNFYLISMSYCLILWWLKVTFWFLIRMTMMTIMAAVALVRMLAVRHLVVRKSQNLWGKKNWKKCDIAFVKMKQ